jgi:uncharacterized protein
MKDIFKTQLHNGQVWSAIVGVHKILRLEALSEHPNVSALFYNADQLLDRYNMPDTLKGQHISKLSVGNCLHSDMGRLLVSMVDSNCDWHDPICGLSTAKQTEEKYGRKTFAEVHNDYNHNGFDNMLVELGKHGLGLKDMVPNINLFSKVSVDDEGQLHYHQNHASLGSYVSLRMEMNVLVVLSNTPHPLAPSGTYPGGAMEVVVGNGLAPDPTADHCILSRPENLRAWENTRDYMLLRGVVQ